MDHQFQLEHFFVQVPGHASVFIGEPRLSDFKQVLTKAGIQAEFSGGALICNNMVAVKKVSFVLEMSRDVFCSY